MTSTASEAASYEFTTLTCIPGVIEVHSFTSRHIENVLVAFVPPTLACLSTFSTKGPTSSCWICQESSRAPHKVIKTAQSCFAESATIILHTRLPQCGWLLCNYDTLTGKGRGRQVIAVARTADVVIMMLDATKGDVQRWVGSSHFTCVCLCVCPFPNYRHDRSLLSLEHF